MGQLAKQFGKQVKALRLARGLSQSQLAEAVSLSEEWIRRIERGEGSPSLDAIEAISAALDEAPATLLGGSSDAGGLPLPFLRALHGLNEQELDWVARAVQLVHSRPEKT